MNRTAVKSDAIQGGGVSYPGKPSCTGVEGCYDAIKPNREGDPEAGQGAKGGRSAESTEDSGPMKPGNSVEDKTLKTDKAL